MALGNNPRFNRPSDPRNIKLAASVGQRDRLISHSYDEVRCDHEDSRDFRAFKAMARYNVGIAQ